METADGLRVSEISLPLMGIRNDNRRDGAHARLHSLPLMGIRNRPARS